MEGDPIEVIQGKGGDTVRVPEHDEPIVAVLENTSDEQHTHLYGTSEDGEVLPGADTGQTDVVLVDPYDMNGGLSNETTSWDMEGDPEESFAISFYDLDAIPGAGIGDTIGADGFGVVRWCSDEDAHLGVDFQGDGNFIVRDETTEDTGQGTQSVFNEIGSGQGGLEIGEGEHLIVVGADERRARVLGWHHVQPPRTRADPAAAVGGPGPRRPRSRAAVGAADRRLAAPVARHLVADVGVAAQHLGGARGLAAAGR